MRLYVVAATTNLIQWCNGKWVNTRRNVVVFRDGIWQRRNAGDAMRETQCWRRNAGDAMLETQCWRRNAGDAMHCVSTFREMYCIIVYRLFFPENEGLLVLGW